MLIGEEYEFGFRRVINMIAQEGGGYQKSQLLEIIVKAFIEQDRASRERFSRVWHWEDWPGSDHSTRRINGVHLVAQERDTGNLVGIQCRYRGRGHILNLRDVHVDIPYYDLPTFSEIVVVSTTEDWRRNVEYELRRPDRAVSVWGVWHFENSSIDWSRFELSNPHSLASRSPKTLRDDQKNAVETVLEGFRSSDRGKLIMPSGSGKTLTALRIAESCTEEGGTFLYLAPSMSLLSQAIREWCNNAERRIRPLVVCSEAYAKGAEKYRQRGDIAIHHMADRPTSEPGILFWQFRRASQVGKRMKVVFSTYEALDIVAKAQQYGLPQFNLIVADDANRPVAGRYWGTMASDSSEYTREHDNRLVKGLRRLYMVATPRIYGVRARRKRRDEALSMDDVAVYGPELYRLDFGAAVDRDIISDYKVVIVEVDREQVAMDLELTRSPEEVFETTTPSPVSGEAMTMSTNFDNLARMVGCWNFLSKIGPTPDEFAYDPEPARRAVAFTTGTYGTRRVAHYFPRVVNKLEKNRGTDLLCHVEHVDLLANADRQAAALEWLNVGDRTGVCTVVSNGRDLTYGPDVPALDAILFVARRRLLFDLVQAIGKVLRKAEGKRLGYIVLPVVNDPKRLPEHNFFDEYEHAYVWQVLSAVGLLDERFAAELSQHALFKSNRGAPSSDRRLEPRENRAEELVWDNQAEPVVNGKLHIIGGEHFHSSFAQGLRRFSRSSLRMG